MNVASATETIKLLLAELSPQEQREVLARVVPPAADWEATLEEADGNITVAAERLGISRKMLRRKMKKAGKYEPGTPGRRWYK